MIPPWTCALQIVYLWCGKSNISSHFLKSKWVFWRGRGVWLGHGLTVLVKEVWRWKAIPTIVSLNLYKNRTSAATVQDGSRRGLVLLRPLCQLCSTIFPLDAKYSLTPINRALWPSTLLSGKKPRRYPGDLLLYQEIHQILFRYVQSLIFFS